MLPKRKMPRVAPLRYSHAKEYLYKASFERDAAIARATKVKVSNLLSHPKRFRKAIASPRMNLRELTFLRDSFKAHHHMTRVVATVINPQITRRKLLRLTTAISVVRKEIKKRKTPDK